MVDLTLHHFDHIHKMIGKLCWKHDDFEELHELKESLMVVKSNYLYSLEDRDYLLNLSKMYYDVLRGEEDKIDEYGGNLSTTQSSFRITRFQRADNMKMVPEGIMEDDFGRSYDEDIGIETHDDHGDNITRYEVISDFDMHSNNSLFWHSLEDNWKNQLTVTRD